MQIIYRVVIAVSYHQATFDFIDPVAACKFADAAKVNNVDGKDGKVEVSIQLFTKEELEKKDD